MVGGGVRTAALLADQPQAASQPAGVVLVTLPDRSVVLGRGAPIVLLLFVL